ncbi:hypothetical protein Tco_0467463 [Tanacetum coccineum]
MLHESSFMVEKFLEIGSYGPSSCMLMLQSQSLGTNDSLDTMADVNVNAPVEQALAMAPPTRTDDQILPRIR